MMEGDHMIIQPLPDHLVEGEHSHIVTKRGSGMTGDDDDGVPLPIPPTTEECLVAPTTTPATASPTPDPRLEPINVFCNTSNDTLAEELKPKVEDYTCKRTHPESLAEASKRLHVIESIIVIDHLSYNIHGKNLEVLFTYIIRLVHIVSRTEKKTLSIIIICFERPPVCIALTNWTSMFASYSNEALSSKQKRMRKCAEVMFQILSHCLP